MAIFRNVQSDNIEINETQANFDRVVKDILERCKTANIEFKKITESFMYDYEYNILIPQGRGHREINIWSARNASLFANGGFEKYRFIAGYNAIYSYKDDTIEAMVRALNPRQMRDVRRRLFEVDDTDDAKILSRVICFEREGTSQRIELGAASNVLRAFGFSSGSALSVKLIGYGAKLHDTALATLERVSDAFFMQLDLVVGMPLGLQRDRQYRTNFTRGKEAIAAIQGMKLPEHEYDHGPVSLYQYGRSADGMPLLQFLAFYQVAEYYYPTYSDADARRRVRNVLKDPNFRETREADIGRLLAIVQAKAGRYGSERGQLKATINECVDAPGLIDFIKSNSSRNAFYTNSGKKGRHPRINIVNENPDILNELASRLYEIRCEIVHTKDADDDGNQGTGRLLPFSVEADQLEHDIALMQYVAQRVLIAASRGV